MPSRWTVRTESSCVELPGSDPNDKNRCLSSLSFLHQEGEGRSLCQQKRDGLGRGESKLVKCCFTCNLDCVIAEGLLGPP